MEDVTGDMAVLVEVARDLGRKAFGYRHPGWSNPFDERTEAELYAAWREGYLAEREQYDRDVTRFIVMDK